MGLKRFHASSTYKRALTELEASTRQLETQLAELMKVKGTSKQRQKVKQTLKTRANQRAALETLSYFTMWDLVHMEVDLRGTTWSDRQVLLWDLPTHIHEGKGEKSLRDWHALPQEVTNAEVDLAEINEEVKNWHGTSAEGDDIIQAIRIGRAGKSVYGRSVRDIIRTYPESMMSETMWDSLVIGEVSAGTLYHNMPKGPAEMLFGALAPSKVLGHYAAINGCSRVGFLRIPVEDADVAWRLMCVTQSSPKYELRRSYVEGLLSREASSGQGSGAAILISAAS